MQCKFCDEEGVRQSLSEAGKGYVIQATCSLCGSGWNAGEVTKAEGDEMRAEQEKQELEAAKLREAAEKEAARLAATIKKGE
jgi:hypothetical protein